MSFYVKVSFRGGEWGFRVGIGFRVLGLRSFTR